MIPHRACPRLRFILLAPFSCFLWLSLPVHAEPYLAVRYGYKCSQCHFNPSGGGKRNSFGNIFTQTELPRHVLSTQDLYRFANLDGEEAAQPSGEAGAEAPSQGEGETRNGQAPGASAPGSTFYTGYLTSFLSFGGDFRFNNRTVLRNANDSKSSSFDVSEGNLYGSVEVFNGSLAFYVDETVAPGGAASREAYAILRGPWGSYLKGGRMMLPYGLRLQDDTAFIREITGFNYGVQDLGVELGAEPGPISTSVALSNGSQGSTDDNLDKQVTGTVSFIQRYWRLGVQGTWNNTANAKRVAVGGFAGINLGRFTVLGELDYLVDELESQPGRPMNHMLLLYGAANYLLAKGVNLQLAYDYADPDTSEGQDSFVRVSTGVELFVTQFTQLRAFYRFRDDTEDSDRDDESVIDLELHLFF